MSFNVENEEKLVATNFDMLLIMRKHEKSLMCCWTFEKYEEGIYEHDRAINFSNEKTHEKI